MASRDRTQTTHAAQGRSVTRIGGLAVLASLSSFFYYVQRSEIFMHGDATAHINIARRVFDSLTPGPLQLGTVWLPLPHILMMPFLVSDKLWQSGIGGSIPSIIAYVLGVLGIARLVGGVLGSQSENMTSARVGVWIAALAYGANPNLIYMQTTALTEPLFLALFIWALVYFAEFARQLGAADLDARCSLRRCAYCIACAELTRYDGWFLAGTIGAIVFVIVLRRWRERALRWSAAKFLVGIAIAPALWLVYNAIIYGNAFDFADGPYSAKAIELRVAAPNPAFHSYWLGGLYFLKSAQMTMAVGNWGRLWLAVALLTTLLAFWTLRTRVLAALVVLWSPLAFYAYSISYGWVPLHVPIWWPHAVFNQRFGIELLPMFAVLVGLFAAAGFQWLRSASAYVPAGLAVTLIGLSYAYVLNAKPLCLVEAENNWNMRRGLDSSVETVMKALPADSMFLMDLGEHVSIMERLGIPLRRVVNGENRRPWVRPTDPESIWERALAKPEAYVNYVIVFEGDSVDRGVNRANLTLLTLIHSMTQPPARIYQTQRATNQQR